MSDRTPHCGLCRRSGSETMACINEHCPIDEPWPVKRTPPMPEVLAPGTLPIGYAVIGPDGYFVGIWRDIDTARLMCNRGRAQGERVARMRFANWEPES